MYDGGLTKSKMYFAALALCGDVLQRLAAVGAEDTLPAIHHGMPESYYKALVYMRSWADIGRLLVLMEAAPDLVSIRDAQFAELLSGGCTLSDDQDAGGEASEMLAFPDRPARLEDLQSLHRTAASILRGIPHEMVDIRSSMPAILSGKKVLVHLDNCSHVSGKQRAYVACRSPHHQACFKYTVVERFGTAAEAVAWLAEWVLHAEEQPAAFTKENRKKYRPPDGVWKDLVKTVVEECS